MITLITGAPGAGKSSALVKLLSELAKNRPIFGDGIPDLKIPHTEIDVTDWPNAVPDGAAVFVDEAQRIWRPAGPGAKIPDHIAKLETHRHRGLDFFVVTQSPKLIHSNVRALVGRHVHLREMGVMGRWWYEWPECSDVGTFRSAPVKKKYRLNKATFDLYKSATEHIKPIRSIPPALLIMIAALIVVAILGWLVFKNISSKVAPSPALTAATKAEPAGLAVGQAGGRITNAVYQPASFESMVVAFTPRLQQQPETAPAYDHLRVVKVMPRIVGGYCQGKTCKCFTQQHTDPGIGSDACRQWIKSPPFDPYREPSKEYTPPPSQSTVAQTTPKGDNGHVDAAAAQ